MRAWGQCERWCDPQCAYADWRTGVITAKKPEPSARARYSPQKHKNKGSAMQGNPQSSNISRTCCAASWRRATSISSTRIYEDQGLVKMYTRLTTKCRKKPNADALLPHPLFGRHARHAPQTPSPLAPRWWRMLQKDLAVEYEVRDALQKAWSCARRRDYVSHDPAAGPAARHRGRPRLLAGKAAGSDRKWACRTICKTSRKLQPEKVLMGLSPGQPAHFAIFDQIKL